jgi:hypothetical protein
MRWRRKDGSSFGSSLIAIRRVGGLIRIQVSEAVGTSQRGATRLIGSAAAIGATSRNGSFGEWNV